MAATQLTDGTGMKIRVIIVGAGGFGRELLIWVKDTYGDDEDIQIAGFLDADPLALEKYDNPLPVLGDPSAYEPDPSDRFICGLAVPAIKLNVCRDMKSRGAIFLTMVHPSAIVGDRSRLGEGCVICPGAIVTADVMVGDFVTINGQATVGHDAVLGDGSTMSGHSEVNGFAELGEGVFLGSHATILPHAKVGSFAKVGAGSVVLKKVKPRTTVMGVPAKMLFGF
jgi:sugar O-acyltransferase (sialic acid O-acetyltransferase NeuD family)